MMRALASGGQGDAYRTNHAVEWSVWDEMPTVMTTVSRVRERMAVASRDQLQA